MENKDRLGQILRFAEGLKQDPNGAELLQEAIKNTQRLRQEGLGVSRTAHLLEQVQKVFELIPGEEKTNN